MEIEWPALQEASVSPRPVALDRGVHGKVQGDSNELRWLAASPGFLEASQDLERRLRIGKTHDRGFGLYWRALPDGCYAAMAIMPSGVYDATDRPALIQRQVWLWSSSPGAARQAAPVQVALGLLGEMARLSEEAVWEGTPSSFWEDHRSMRAVEGLVKYPTGLDAPGLAEQLEQGREDLAEVLDQAQLASIYQSLLVPEAPPMLVPLPRPLSPQALICLLLPLPRELADGVSLAGWLMSREVTPDVLEGNWDVAFCHADHERRVAPLEPGGRARSMAEALIAGDPRRIRASDEDAPPPGESRTAQDETPGLAEAAHSIEEIQVWWVNNYSKFRKEYPPDDPAQLAEVALAKVRNDFLQAPGSLEYFQSMPRWNDAVLTRLHYPLQRHEGSALQLIQLSHVWRGGSAGASEDDIAFMTWREAAMSQLLDDIQQDRLRLEDVGLDRPLMDQLYKGEPELWVRWLCALLSHRPDRHLRQQRQADIIAYASRLPGLEPVLQFCFSTQPTLEPEELVGAPEVASGQRQLRLRMNPYSEERRGMARALLKELHELAQQEPGEDTSSRAASLRALAYAMVPDGDTASSLPLGKDATVSPLLFLPHVGHGDGELLRALGSDFLEQAIMHSEGSRQHQENRELFSPITTWVDGWRQEERAEARAQAAADRSASAEQGQGEASAVTAPERGEGAEPGAPDQAQLAVAIAQLLAALPDSDRRLGQAREELVPATVDLFNEMSGDVARPIQEQVRKLMKVLSWFAPE